MISAEITNIAFDGSHLKSMCEAMGRMRDHGMAGLDYVNAVKDTFVGMGVPVPEGFGTSTAHASMTGNITPSNPRVQNSGVGSFIA